MMTAYEQAEKYILDIPKFAGKHTLKDTNKLLHALVENPEQRNIIHVAGTNGKGSVCAYLRGILMEAGFQVGMFTSPHLETMRERICIGNEMISEKDFVRIYARVKKETEKREEMTHPSFFEFLFLMAMKYFEEKNVDYVILETGMGGRLDATNVFQKERVCVITGIGLDHMQYLGNTVEEIAKEKAGIMKPQIPVVFFDKDEKVTAILEDIAKKTQSPVIIVKKTDILDVNIHNKSIDFSLYTGYYKYITLSLDTIALYQIENAALAVRAVEQLKEENITAQHIRSGIFKTYWPGRMEEIAPGIYMDGAHNEDGMDAFLETVKRDGCKGQRFLLFGAAADKQYGEMIRKLKQADLFDRAAVTTLDSKRSVPFDKMKEAWERYDQTACRFFRDAQAAYRFLLADKQKEDMIYIAGSLYLAGQIKTLMRRSPND